MNCTTNINGLSPPLQRRRRVKRGGRQVECEDSDDEGHESTTENDLAPAIDHAPAIIIKIITDRNNVDNDENLCEKKMLLRLSPQSAE